jgi:hypothetical protein
VEDELAAQLEQKRAIRGFRHDGPFISERKGWLTIR